MGADPAADGSTRLEQRGKISQGDVASVDSTLGKGHYLVTLAPLALPADLFIAGVGHGRYWCHR
jgi:hypothetical protein